MKQGSEKIFLLVFFSALLDLFIYLFSHAAVIPRTLSTDRGREKCFRKGRLTPYVS